VLDGRLGAIEAALGQVRGRERDVELGVEGIALPDAPSE
jgi:hypothetical protein